MRLHTGCVLALAQIYTLGLDSSMQYLDQGGGLYY